MNARRIAAVLASFAALACAGAGLPSPAPAPPLGPLEAKAAEPAPTDIPGSRTLKFDKAREQLAIDPQADPYRPTLPPALQRPGWVHVVLLLRVCVSEAGEGSNVVIIRRGDMLVDPPAVHKVKSWKYRPLMVDGTSTPFCYPLRIDLTPEDGASYR